MQTDPRQLAGRRVLVTGASGFIGCHLCRRLVDAGAVVWGTSRRDRTGEDVRWLTADLADHQATRRAIEQARPELVFHLASHVYGSRDLEHVMPAFQANLVSTVNLLHLLTERGCDRLVLAGSMEEPERGAAEVIPASPYAVAKAAASLYTRFFHDLYATPVVLARIFMVYGPDQQDLNKLVPYVARTLLAGEAPSLSSGTREVDWIYVEDVADGLVALALAPGIEGETIDLGSGELVSVRGVAELLHDIIGSDATPTFGVIADRRREQVRVAKVEETANRVGWQPQVSLREGLERTVEWCRGLA